MGFEGGGRFEGRKIEANNEFGELRNVFFRVVRAGTLDELVVLLQEQPQRHNGKLLWLLTSGLAVELLTGARREHKDLDVVVMDPKNEARWEILGTDNVTPQKYWADMFFDPKFLEKTAVEVDFEYQDRTYKVLTVHPMVIMTQKLSNAFGRNPREKDLEDAFEILVDWEGKKKGKATWINYVKEALHALPHNQKVVTEGRINHLVPHLFPLKVKQAK